MGIREIDFEDTELSKIEVINNHYSNEVILKDFYHGWLHGNLSESKMDGTYLLRLKDGENEKRLHYHDLEQLLQIIKSTKHL